MDSPKWAANSAQWIRTALTDVMHAVGTAEEGRNSALVAKYKELARQLQEQELYLIATFGVRPATGVGSRRKKDKK